MVVNNNLVGQITTQAVLLPFGERLRLIHQVVDTLSHPQQTEQRQYLAYGQFRGSQMSTEDDFCLAEWIPIERNLDGA